MHWTRVSTRFSDQDSVGHINNVAYAAYFEAGRIDFIHRLAGPWDPGAAAAMVIASLRIDYLQEMFYPGDVLVGSRVARIGERSFVIACAACKDGTVHASAECVMVCLDPASGRATAIPAPLREALQRETGRGSTAARQS